MVPCKGGPAPGRQWTAIGIRRVKTQRWCGSWEWGWWRVGPEVWGSDMCSGSELYHATQHRRPSLHLSPTKLRSVSTRMYKHTYKHTFFRQFMVWTHRTSVSEFPSENQMIIFCLIHLQSNPPLSPHYFHNVPSMWHAVFFNTIPSHFLCHQVLHADL